VGYFDAAFVVEMNEVRDGISLRRTHYGAGSTEKMLFFWSEGDRTGTDGLQSYAEGSLLCTHELFVTPGYPSSQTLGKGPGESPDLVYVDENFNSFSETSSFLFHFLLPARFVPRPGLRTFDVPSDPSVIVRAGERLSATFIVKGGARARFWLNRLSPKETFDGYDLDRIFDKPVVRETKASMELNFGILKFTLGNK
jgi:hypothetical protein